MRCLYVSERIKKNIELGCKTRKNNKQRPVEWKIMKNKLLEIEMLQGGYSLTKEKLVHSVCILPGVLPFHS